MERPGHQVFVALDVRGEVAALLHSVDLQSTGPGLVRFGSRDLRKSRPLRPNVRAGRTIAAPHPNRTLCIVVDDGDAEMLQFGASWDDELTCFEEHR